MNPSDQKASPEAGTAASQDALRGSRLRTGILYAFGAFSMWGLLVPLHFKLLAALPAFEILAHRIVWACLFACALILIRKEGRELGKVLTLDRRLALLGASAALVSVNWLVYIWAVNAGYLVQTSLGYFINPLFNVVLGVLFLRERLQPAQILACGVAAAGVLVLTIASGQFPWVALALAISFGFYGLVRKVVPVGALTGFCVESLLLAPFALAYLIWTLVQGEAAVLRGDLTLDILLLLTGVTTATPLIWFAEAARRLKLSTIGLLQYLSPSGQLILGVLAYGEPFGLSQAVAFGAIWTALVIYSISAFRGLDRSAAHGAPAAKT